MRSHTSHTSHTSATEETALRSALDDAIVSWRRRDRTFLVMLVEAHPWGSPGGWLGSDQHRFQAEEIVSRLRPLTGVLDRIFRLPEGQVAVICTDISDREEARRVATRLTEEASISEHGNDAGPIMVSSGAALASGVHADADDILADAGSALRLALERPGTHTVILDESLRVGLMNRSRSFDRITSGSGQQGFHLHYQPIFSAEDDSLTAVEALLRWNDGQPPRSSAQDLVLFAEQTDWIRPLGLWILEQAVIQGADWGRRYPECFATYVNVSSGQLATPRFARDVRRILDDNGLSPSRLGIEVTESCLLDQEAVDSLRELREIGVLTALDDFGTGFSGLSSLTSVPVDRIKLDMSFVQRLADRAVHSVSSAIVALAHDLGIKVTAEGVETEVQRAAVKGIGCDDLQGFLMARPDGVSALEPLLRNSCHAIV